MMRMIFVLSKAFKDGVPELIIRIAVYNDDALMVGSSCLVSLRRRASCKIGKGIKWRNLRQQLYGVGVVGVALGDVERVW
ncbi:hypothetical protein Acr_20g0010900 [Actinidia rufa]|uniref:Uncharacterized protein n=1 Tax=Actinidia rufa TaxID=165716 RepID=A0A7J0GEY0_9ERIC|nr:hypothetical protein Acr_20g0010900 [Actinidia rufa]